MKQYKILIFLVLLLTACTQDFEEINTNPNYPTVAQANPGLLLPKVLFEVGNSMTAGLGWGCGNIIAQLVATNNFTGTDRYLLGTYGGEWNMFYRNMRDANNLYEIGKNTENKAYQAAALVLRSWMVANLTEFWGDVPYSEALKGKAGEFKPKFDDQKEIYQAILADLKEAAELAEQGGSLKGDILYGSDMSKWQKLANSLRVRYLMRLEKKWSELGIDGAAQLESLLSSGKVFSSNADHAAISYLPGTNRWPLNTSRVGSFDEKRMSKRIELVLKDLQDPRMPVLFREMDNPDSTGFRGIPNGLSEDAASNFNNGANNQSRLGTRFREEPAAVEMIIMNYSELMFIAAEAAQKGYISGNASDFYEAGVTANMNYYDIMDTEGYLAQSNVALSTGDELVKIATQKWLSLFLIGNEAWYDFRRTGLPALTPGPNATLSELPVRVLYPDDEQVLNADNYKAVIAKQGPNELTTKMWLLK